MTVEMFVSGGALVVQGPRDRILGALMNVLGGKWNGEAWVLEPKHEGAVREYVRQISARPAPRLRVVPHEPVVDGLPPIERLFDPSVDLAEQISTLAAISAHVDLASAPADAIDELAAAFETLSARLRARSLA